MSGQDKPRESARLLVRIGASVKYHPNVAASGGLLVDPNRGTKLVLLHKKKICFSLNESVVVASPESVLGHVLLGNSGFECLGWAGVRMY